MANQFIIRKPTATWTAENPTLLENQLGVESSLVNGVETDSGQAKLGDGVTLWDDLPYFTPALMPTQRTIIAATGNITSADNGGMVICDRGTGQTITVDPDLGQGFNCLVVQIGAGQVTLAEGSGVTLNNADSFLAISAQYGAATLYAYAADTFYLGGQLA